MSSQLLLFFSVYLPSLFLTFKQDRILLICVHTNSQQNVQVGGIGSYYAGIIPASQPVGRAAYSMSRLHMVYEDQ